MGRSSDRALRLLRWLDDRLEDGLVASWRLGARTTRDVKLLIASPLLVLALLWCLCPVSVSLRRVDPPPSAASEAPATRPEHALPKARSQFLTQGLAPSPEDLVIVAEFFAERAPRDVIGRESERVTPKVDVAELDRVLARLTPDLATTMTRIDAAHGLFAGGMLSPVAIRSGSLSVWLRSLSAALKILAVHGMRLADQGDSERAAACAASGLRLIILTWDAVDHDHDATLMVTVIQAAFMRRMSAPALYRGACRSTLQTLAELLSASVPAEDCMTVWLRAESSHAVSLYAPFLRAELSHEFSLPASDWRVGVELARSERGGVLEALRELIDTRSERAIACLRGDTQVTLDRLRDSDAEFMAQLLPRTALDFVWQLARAGVSRDARAAFLARLMTAQAVMPMRSQLQPWLLIQRHASLMAAGIGLEFHRIAIGKLPAQLVDVYDVLPESTHGLLEQRTLRYTAQGDHGSLEMLPLRFDGERRGEMSIRIGGR